MRDSRNLRNGLYNGAIVIALSLVFVGAQMFLRRERSAEVPVAAESAYATLGGLRALAAEAIWFRADRLQDEGRYVELAQLASALTAMEPHTSEVWSYAAWNLAYNVSVMMATDEDRWRWIDAAICLLRDEGLKLNPGDSELCRELAWLFQLKLAGDIDTAAATYRRKWRERVEDVRARSAWAELGMDEGKMARLTERTGYDDWTDPSLSAIYWAIEGLPQAKGADRRFLETIVRQSDVLYRKRH